MELFIRQAPSVLVAAEPNPVPLAVGESPLDRINDRGVIRIGFHPDHLPYSYFNQAGHLVGFDIGMAHMLALDLGVHIEFAPFDFDTLAQQMQDDHFDIAMAGVPGNALRSEQMNVSDPYLFVTMSLVVPDHRDNEFATFDAIRELGAITFGMHRDFAYRLERARSDLKTYAPDAELIVLDSYRDFFEQKGTGKGVDALITSAEGGSAWTLLYPAYQVATPLGDDVSFPLVYPYSNSHVKMDEFIDHWVVYLQRDGTVKRLYDHWILGKDAEPIQPRWSIIRNVLHWVD
jgi:ABC-type amino acid transport substrate-binding protein